jgi:hypothetical protein
MIWIPAIVSLVQAQPLRQASCTPINKPVVYAGMGVLSTQGALDVYFGLDGDIVTTFTISKAPCLRIGLREHLTMTSPWIEEGATGYEFISKSHLMIGSYSKLTDRINLGGYLLTGIKVHHVRHTVDYEEREISEVYTGTAVRPSLYLYSNLDYFPWDNLGFNVNVSVPLMDFEREMYWYVNRIVGVGIQWLR